MNLADIKRRVKNRLGDTAGTKTTDAQIVDWVNDGLVEIARRTNLPQASATTATVVGQASYSLTTFAADVLRLRAVLLDGSVLEGISHEEADTFLTDRERSTVGTGTPSHFWVWADTITLWPKPAAVGTLKLNYVKRPAQVSLDADVPGIPTHFHVDLLDYVLAQALEGAEQHQVADRARARFEAGAAQAAQDESWPVRNVYPHVTVSADDAGYY